ncbi:HNH DNAse [Agrobacterium phage OLIVR5]|uniref:HNH DNAse n=2 Tax=Caudoviricetes TaxID=2731619 RepID=A0A858MZA1_9CAUD|nr:HNH DNAse [Agrobacterium phage OLIVR5]QIW87885.1 HNH DNAse [Agrobacterium phage OLIVR5]QIW88150.1 HNH DNAse [Agrobacterium phage OLIVR6]
MKSGKLISPDGILHEFVGRAEFCLEHGLNKGAISQLLLGKSASYKGWTLPK